MSNQFSSSDIEVLHRDITLKLEEQFPTAVSEIIQVYDINKCVDFIQEHNCLRVALQFPDELLVDATNIIRILQSKCSAKFFLLADTSYGSYDVDEIAAQHVQADLIIHYGKSALTATAKTKTIFVFGKKDLSENNVYNSFVKLYADRESKIVLVTQLAWAHVTGMLKEKFQKIYPQLIVAEVDTPTQADIPTQEDDNCSNSCPDCTCKADKEKLRLKQDLNNDGAYRFSGYKLFLPEGASFEDYSLFYIGSSNSETLRNILLSHPSIKGHVFDPESSNCSPIALPANKILMRRFYIVEKIKDAKSVGVLVGTLGMAGFIDIISHLKKIVSACGKKAYTFVVGKLNPNKLANFPEIDIFVLVACPEESLVDQSEYFKPICTPYEVELACNSNRQWGSAYPLDFRQILPGGKQYVEFKPRLDEGDISLITGDIRSVVGCGEPNESNAVEVRNQESALSVFHPHSAALHYSDKTWKGLEQKLGETPVTKAKEGRSGLPIAYTYESAT